MSTKGDVWRLSQSIACLAVLGTGHDFLRAHVQQRLAVAAMKRNRQTFNPTAIHNIPDPANAFA
jgi:hypothetical protein